MELLIGTNRWTSGAVPQEAFLGSDSIGNYWDLLLSSLMELYPKVFFFLVAHMPFHHVGLKHCNAFSSVQLLSCVQLFATP